MYFWNRGAKTKRQKDERNGREEPEERQDRDKSLNMKSWRCRGALEVIQCIILLKAQSTTTDSLGLCPVLFWKSHRMVTPQSLQAPSASCCQALLTLENAVFYISVYTCHLLHFYTELLYSVSLFFSLNKEEHGHPTCKHLIIKIFLFPFLRLTLFQTLNNTMIILVRVGR